MTSRVIPVAPFVLVVFGATGDLARRKLLPAMYHRDIAGQVPEEANIIGVSRGAMESAVYVAQAREAVLEHVPASEVTEPGLQKFLDRVSYVQAPADNDAGWPALKDALAAFPGRVHVFYLATAPALFGPICERLGRFGLAGENARVVVEKPVGRSLDSARAVNKAVGAVFPEERVYRIDHYLGKEAVQNLLALRFANALFEPLWNAAHIDHVQITVAESLGVEGRAGYYDNAGAPAHDETVTALVEGARCRLWGIVEAGRQRPAGREACHAQPADRRLAAARDHHIGIVQRDQAGRVADGMRPGRASRDHRMVGPAETVIDRNMARRLIDQRRRDEKG